MDDHRLAYALEDRFPPFIGATPHPEARGDR